MRILFVSYGNIEYDGRLRSLLSVFSKIGDVIAITRGNNPFNNNSIVCNLPYFKFIFNTLNFAKKNAPFDWLVLDNRKATIPGFIIQKKYKPTNTILDCRELYLLSETKHFAGIIGCIFEKIMAKRANHVICANEDRSRIMQKEYGLSSRPISYENYRMLQYDSEDARLNATRKYSAYFRDDEYRIISTSGCTIKRTNDILVNNIDKVQCSCRLFLVGKSSIEDETAIRDIISQKGLNNVEILGELNQAELKYLISQCHIGIVNYGQYDTNNKYCASGKLFEFLYEGIPVVTTSNPPLKSMCDSYKIGVVDDNYADGIQTILKDYSSFQNNVSSFVKVHTISDNDEKLVKELMEFA